MVNKMLDMLPQELFRSPDTTFLDPACKTGVFLREIAKRLLVGLEDKIPDLQERIDHIFHKQLYGIAITELTSLLSRRSLYCSKYPNGRYSISHFDDVEGNIRFKKIKHTWEKGNCIYCGASKKEYDREADMETHAYEWIHTKTMEEIFKMKFDVIISNPPFQMGFGLNGGNSSNAKSIYNLFIAQAIKLNPSYLVMITPSRWMTKTAQGIPVEWIDEMLKGNHFEELHDFPNAADCFPGVSVMGGVSFFKWTLRHNGKCKYVYHYANSEEIEERYDYLDALNSGIVIRDPKAYSIIEKITEVEGQYYMGDNTFTSMVSPKHYFDNGTVMTSNWKGYSDKKTAKYNIKYYISKSFNDKEYGYISIDQLPKNQSTVPLHKVYIPAAHGSFDSVLGKPFYGEPNSVCSQTYLVIGYDAENHNLCEDNCKNIITYIQTKFFRYLVGIKKKTQNGPRGVYQFVPLQDFTKPWTDEKLYRKYSLTQEEIDLIESTIKPMDLTGGDE